MMIKNGVIFAILVVVFMSCVDIGLSTAPPPSVISKEDLKYIGCEVCENMVDALKSTLDDLKANSPTGKLGELVILETMEQICNPQNDTGVWIKKQDIVESNSRGLAYLKLVQPGGISKCGDECVTIAKSCQMIFDNEIDLDDLSVVFIKKASFNTRDMQKKVCSSMTNRCKTAAKHVDPKYKRLDKKFVAMKEKDVEMEKMMASMKAMGMSSQMYGRDEMDGMMGGGGGGDSPYGDDYDEDEMEAMRQAQGGGFSGGDEDDPLYTGMPPGMQDKPFQAAGSNYEF